MQYSFWTHRNAIMAYSYKQENFIYEYNAWSNDVSNNHTLSIIYLDTKLSISQDITVLFGSTS